MKFRTLTIAILFIIAMPGIRAGIVTHDMADKVARNFLAHISMQYNPGHPVEKACPSDAYIFSEKGSPVFYAYNLEPGFILVSGEDAFTPVIGYSFEGDFDLEGAPSHFKGFIQNYIDQVKYIRDHNLAAEPQVTAAWDELLADTPDFKSLAGRDRDVEPLLYCKWDQGSPYNMLCPEDEAGPGGHVWVGCVATAMAQVMYYWRYPEVGTGSHCYYPENWQYGEQCADFGSTNYDWEGMINSIDLNNVYPNAELQYHCAVSVDMQFSPDGSGSWSHIVPERLAQYWGYNDAEILWRDDYNLVDWIGILQDELDASHPMYYSGYNDSYAGHAFVCDGYQGENFHFNFGWGGSGNGYFTLYNVGGFYNGQACIRYFVPSDPAYPYYSSGDHLFTEMMGSFTDGSGPVENYTDNQDATWLIDLQASGDSIVSISLSFTQFDLTAGDTLKVFDGATTGDPLIGAYTSITAPQQINSTGDVMLVTFTSNTSGTAPGFYAEYVANRAVYCSGLTTFTEPYGTLSDGSGTFNYHNNSYCTWYIKPQSPGTITLTFDAFESEQEMDFLAIFDGNTKIGEYSGSELPGQVVATSGTMFIAWMTDGNTNAQGWRATYEVAPVGLPEPGRTGNLATYPNPASEKLTILFTAVDNDEEVMISLESLTGTKVYRESSEMKGGLNRFAIDVEEFPAGLYFLEVVTSSGKFSDKVVITH
jgi:hypothetical protein